MTLTKQDRETMALRDTMYVYEDEVIAEGLRAYMGCARSHGIIPDNSDGIAAVEAAMIRHLLAARECWTW